MHDHPDNLAPTERFSLRAEHYAKYRPGYPSALVDFLVHELGFVRDSAIADIGSGTGILSRLLLERRITVLGVEPNRQMRQAAESSLSSYPGFLSINGTAEATTLATASVDGVVAAQAFHWFDPQKAIPEFHRIAKPGASLALIWNVRKSGAPFMGEYQRIVQRFGPEVEFPLETLSGLFGPSLRHHTFDNSQELDWERLRGRVLSASYMPAEGSPAFEPMIMALRQAFDRHQTAGRLRLDYETHIYSCPLRVEQQ
jgi:SAM-dependent methyltransferase